MIFRFKCSSKQQQLIHKSDNQKSHEKSLIIYYFCRGFNYKAILYFLEAQHNVVIRHRALLCQLEQYGLYNYDNLRFTY